MSLPFSGVRLRPAGLITTIMGQLKRVNLKPVKKINIRFDPFHERSKETRDFLYRISAPKVTATNPYCSLKTEIVCDRSEPTVTFNLHSGEKVVFKTALLTSLNILELYNKHITALVPPDPAELEAKKELIEKKKKRKRPHHKRKEGSKHKGTVL